jgi:uncharacterized repeat protein (TIGR01451 family)
MTTSAKRFLSMLIVAALVVAAMGMASVGASSPPAAPSVRGVSAPPVAPPALAIDPIDSWAVDLADPYDWNDPTCAGWLLRYTLTFTNTSGQTLWGLVLSDTIPANTEFKESSEGGVFDGVDTITWTLDPIEADQVISRELVIRPFTNLAAGTIITDVVAVLVDLGDEEDMIVIENAEEGTTIMHCATPTPTPSPTVPSPTPKPPTVTPTATATATATEEPNGKIIWLPIIVHAFEH